MPGLCVSPPGGAEPPNGPVHQHDNVRPPPARGLPAGRELNSNKGEEWPQICQEGSIREPEPKGKLGALLGWGRGRPEGCCCGGRRSRESRMLFRKSSGREKRCRVGIASGWREPWPRDPRVPSVNRSGLRASAERGVCARRLCLLVSFEKLLSSWRNCWHSTFSIVRGCEVAALTGWLTSKWNLNV